jgi:alkanesulfonate monooxygenase SsuD/methylene tetrahydromethanopterin reductase-like flavin-dependent oxidoreductase (luciferase family)
MAAHDARKFRGATMPGGALLIGSPDEVVDKILRHADALGGFSRVSFQKQ